LLSDYLKIRKAKKAGEFTKTAFEGIEREALAAGISIVDAIRICVERGWVGFKSEWIENQRTKNRDSDLQWFLNNGKEPAIQQPKIILGAEND
jgi:hypothetical protein